AAVPAHRREIEIRDRAHPGGRAGPPLRLVPAALRPEADAVLRAAGRRADFPGHRRRRVCPHRALRLPAWQSGVPLPGPPPRHRRTGAVCRRLLGGDGSDDAGGGAGSAAGARAAATAAGTSERSVTSLSRHVPERGVRFGRAGITFSPRHLWLRRSSPTTVIS